MRNLKFQISLATLLFFFLFFTASSNAHALVLTLNGQNGFNQTFQNDSNVGISSTSNVHTITWQSLLPISRGGTGTSSFTTGSIPFIFGGIFAQDNLNFFWDNTNKRLGIGTSSPTSTLSVNGNASMSGNLDVTGTISSPALNNFVPYTGAVGNVNLGTNSLIADSLTTTKDSTINTLSIGLSGGSDSANIAIGSNEPLSNNSVGTRNVALGYGTLKANVTSSDNTAIGHNALTNASGEKNTAIGSGTLVGFGLGSRNSALGHATLENNTSGDNNVALGSAALNANTTGSGNVAIGYASLGGNASENVAIGQEALGRNSTGGGNVVLGFKAAQFQADGSSDLTTANSSIYIGKFVRGNDNNDSNSIVIGYNAIGAGANKAVFGNSSLTDIYFGSSLANAYAHAKALFLGSSNIPGCIIIGDSDGNGVTYLTANDGVLATSATKPGTCP